MTDIISIYFSDSWTLGKPAVGKQESFMRRSLMLGLFLACSADPPTGMQPAIMCTGDAANQYRVDLAGSGFGEFTGKTLHAVTEIQLARSTGSCSTADTAAIS